jgi:Tol biopolymer transport system component
MRIGLAVMTAFVGTVAGADRQPVLGQIDLPHNYYFREMYLPQLTNGPSSVTWGPDSKRVIYSRAGSLWMQDIGSTKSVEITNDPGYNYQPDWSPDGNYLVYASYQNGAIELWVRDLRSQKRRQITSGGAVNVEPRWSPDSKRIAFVSYELIP